MKKIKKTSGFTMMEMILVVATIALLAGVIAVAINPSQQLANSRNAQRKSDVGTLYKALFQYATDNGGFPEQIPEGEENAVLICQPNQICDGISLDALIENERYLESLPIDPTVSGSTTGYAIFLDAGGLPVIKAANAELGVNIIAPKEYSDVYVAELSFGWEDEVPTTEVMCYNGSDDDSDGLVDCADSDCDAFCAGSGSCTPSATSGDDTITCSGLSIPHLFAGGGADSISIVAGSSWAGNTYLQAGDDTLTVGSYSTLATINTDTGNDSITLEDYSTFGGYNDVNNDTSVDSIVAGNRVTATGSVYLYGAADSLEAGFYFSSTGHIFAGGGNDTLTFGPYLNQSANIYLDAGDDSLSIGVGSSTGTINSGSGNDTVIIASESDVSSYIDDNSTGIDTLTIGNNVALGSVYLYGGADILTVGTYFTSTGHIFGGSGNDTFTFGTNMLQTSANIYLDEGDDSLSIGLNSSVGTIIAGSGGDTVLIGNNSDFNGYTDENTSTGGGDTLTLGNSVTSTGAIYMYGAGDELTAGDDFTSQGHIMMGAGDDAITIDDNFTQVSGNIYLDSGDDALTIGNYADFGQISAGGGADVINIGYNATFTGYVDSNTDDSIDTITVGANAIIGSIYTYGGADILIFGDDTVKSGHTFLGNGDDTLTFGANSIISSGNIYGENGNDTITLGAGTTFTGGGQVICGNGNDTLIGPADTPYDSSCENFTVIGSGGDTTDPTLSSTTPTNGATGVANDANLVLTFDETVYDGSGSITIYTSGAALFEAITVPSAKVTGSGSNTITVNPASDFTEGEGYYVEITSGTFEDGSGNQYAGNMSGPSWNFTIDDGSCTPAGSGTTAFTVTSHPEWWGGGDYTSLLAGYTGSWWDSGCVTTASSTPIYTNGTSYQVGAYYFDNLVDAQALTNYEMVSEGDAPNECSYMPCIYPDEYVTCAADSTASCYDGTPPTLSTKYPADNLSGASIYTNLVLTFNETVYTGSGTVKIYTVYGSLVESISVTGGQVTGSGTTQIQVNPSSNLSASTSYYIRIDATAFRDANYNYFAGISDNTTWNFDTTHPGNGCYPAATSGDDWITCTGTGITGLFSNTGGNDHVYVTSGSTLVNSIFMGSGNDEVTVQTGASITSVFFSGGNDTLIMQTGSTASNSIFCDSGTDSVTVPSGTSTFSCESVTTF